MLIASLLLITLKFWTCRAQLTLSSTQTVITSYVYTEKTETLTKQTPCFITTGPVSQCGLWRGIPQVPDYYFHQFSHDEDASDQQELTDIVSPSKVAIIEATAAPSSTADDQLLLPQSIHSSSVFSSIIDPADEHLTRQSSSFNNLVLRLVTETMVFATLDENCAGSTIHLFDFLNCLGMPPLADPVVQETVTITQTVFTKIVITSVGYTTVFTLAGCTPLGFPFYSCPAVPADSSSHVPSTAVWPSAVS